MPDLPTLTVSDEQQAVILEAFKDFYGTDTAQETVVAYKRHLARMIISVVKDFQAGVIETQQEALINAKIAEVDAFFPNPDTIT